MARKTFQGSHLELRYNTYYAVLYVPADVRDIIGKRKFYRSTKTGDLALAETRAAAYVLGWKAEISRARQSIPDPFIAEALDLLSVLRDSTNPSDVLDVIKDVSAEHARQHDFDLIGEEFEAMATGKRLALATLLPEWKAHEQARGLAAKTIDQAAKDVQLLVKQFATVATLKAEYIDYWLKEIAEEDALSASSVNRIVTSCRSFFSYLKHIGVVPPDALPPFHVPQQYKKSKKANTKAIHKTEHWVPFAPTDIKLLYLKAEQNNDKSLADLILIGAHTGARIEEICSLKCDHVSLSKGSITIVESKTTAGTRTIPIHSRIKDKIRELLDDSSDGYLLSDLTFNKYGDRSNAVGKRFGRLKKAMGYSPQHVFHSIRKTFTTMLENAHVNENIAADILGHEKPRITYGVYSGGTTLRVMAQAIRKIDYGF